VPVFYLIEIVQHRLHIRIMLFVFIILIFNYYKFINFHSCKGMALLIKTTPDTPPRTRYQRRVQPYGPSTHKL